MIKIFSEIDELNHFAAEKFVEIASEAIEKRDYFTVSLSGGSTPKSFYQLLASEKCANQINWNGGFYFFGDERNVPLDDEESNHKMAAENLFVPLKIRDLCVMEWNTEPPNDAEKSAEWYEETMTNFFTLDREINKFPRFDLILLGMGADGHTASLFPYTKALHETERLAVANYVEKLQTYRLTMTFPVINNAANVMFLVTGAEKAEALREVLQSEYNPEKFPAQKVKPNNGNLLWLVDAKAGEKLDGDRTTK